MSDTPTTTPDLPTYVRDRLAEHLDGLGYTVEPFQYAPGAPAVEAESPTMSTWRIVVTRAGLLTDADRPGTIVRLPGFDTTDAVAEWAAEVQRERELRERPGVDWPEWVVEHVDNVTTGDAHQVGTLTALDHQRAERAALVRGIIPSGVTFRVRPAPLARKTDNVWELVETYALRVGERPDWIHDPATVLVDLVADLLHLADLRRVDAEDIASAAVDHYTAEVEELRNTHPTAELGPWAEGDRVRVLHGPLSGGAGTVKWAANPHGQVGVALDTGDLAYVDRQNLAAR